MTAAAVFGVPSWSRPPFVLADTGAPRQDMVHRADATSSAVQHPAVADSIHENL